MSIPLDVDTIEAARTGAAVGAKIVLFKSTASTNDIAWQYAANPANNGLCVLAESQSAGRGRRGRTWHSQPGQSILLSVLLLDQPDQAGQLTLTVAIAAAEAVIDSTGLAARIKWPNDILVNGQKLAGILVEKKNAGRQSHYVIGIGMNCNQLPDAFENDDLHLPATSLRMETNNEVDRNSIAAAILASLEKWLSCEDHRLVVNRWQQLSALLGHHITVESNNQRYSGFCRGIDPTDGLIVQLDAGPVKIFHAAQTSIETIAAVQPDRKG